ncbi:hypothetical protein Tco_0157829 [Tanacetum coccineum]
MFILCCMNRRLEAVADTSELRDEEATSEGAELNQTTTKIEAHLPSLRGHVGEDAKVGMWDGKVGLLEGPSLLSRTVSASPPSTITIKNLNPPETPTRKHVKKRSSEVPEEESVHREKKRKGLGNTHKTKEENTALGHTNRGTVEMIRGGGCRLVDSPIVLEVYIEGFQVRRIYVDGGCSSEARNEELGICGVHNLLDDKISNRQRDSHYGDQLREVPPKEKHLEEAKPSPPMENNITSKVGSEGQEAPAKACEEGRPPEQVHDMDTTLHRRASVENLLTYRTQGPEEEKSVLDRRKVVKEEVDE